MDKDQLHSTETYIYRTILFFATLIFCFPLVIVLFFMWSRADDKERARQWENTKAINGL
jgi:hypothetical protein